MDIHYFTPHEITRSLTTVACSVSVENNFLCYKIKFLFFIAFQSFFIFVSIFYFGLCAYCIRTLYFPKNCSSSFVAAPAFPAIQSNHPGRRTQPTCTHDKIKGRGAKLLSPKYGRTVCNKIQLLDAGILMACDNLLSSTSRIS